MVKCAEIVTENTPILAGRAAVSPRQVGWTVFCVPRQIASETIHHARIACHGISLGLVVCYGHVFDWRMLLAEGAFD